jgi:hypothetical protein
MPALQSAVIWINRLRNRASSRRYPPENVLVLLPHCLQHRACKEPVKEAIGNCKGCGRCKMKELRDLAERAGVRVHVASGGREALERTRVPEVRVILAVACSKELSEGIRAAFPKRVVGILNSWPHGPCKDTDVDVRQVESALNRLVKRG